MKRSSLPRPRQRGRIGSTLVLLVAALASGCLVSFDGYQPLGLGDAGDDSGGGSLQGGKSTGGKSSGASDAGGKSGEGANASLGGEGGEPDTNGGVSGGGSTNGGKAGTGGSSAGSGGSGGASAGAGGNGGTGGQSPQTCPVNLEGPPMIEIPKPGGGFFCMDRTEVPAEDYATFLASTPSTSGQSATCTWNTTYEPDTTNTCVAPSGAYDPKARPRSPVACIDWCDAKRYCEWAGKRLCGGINGGSNPVSKFADADSSQWYRACSKAGTQKFPYGDTYQSQYCVGLDNSGSHPSSVAAAVACEGGYPGLFDMSGNVAEWEDSCSGSAGSGDNCLIRGGNMLQAERTAPSLLCNSSKLDAQTPTSASAKRNAKSEHIGLRCCLDL